MNEADLLELQEKLMHEWENLKEDHIYFPIWQRLVHILNQFRFKEELTTPEE